MANTHDVHRYKPIQIIPCEPGWTVHYWSKDRKTLDSLWEPLAMWALCEWTIDTLNSETRKKEHTLDYGNTICGIIYGGEEGMSICEETDNLAGYKHPSVSLEDCRFSEPFPT